MDSAERSQRGKRMEQKLSGEILPSLSGVHQSYLFARLFEHINLFNSYTGNIMKTFWGSWLKCLDYFMLTASCKLQCMIPTVIPCHFILVLLVFVVSACL